MKLPKLKYWYHATPVDKANKIINCGHLVPQAHQGDLTLGVFFANTFHNAAYWMLMRGITDYVVFKIPRSRLNPNNMFLGGADRLPKELNMICMRHLAPVPVQDEDVTVVKDQREFAIPGVEVFTDGTRRTGMKIVDMAAFEAYIEANPELKKMIEQSLEV